MQGFPQVLRTWEEDGGGGGGRSSSKFDGRGLNQYMEGPLGVGGSGS